MIYKILLYFAANPYGLPEAPTTDDKLKQILNIVLIILGAISVLVIIIAGLDFMFSQGEPDKVSRARNTIIYALIGLAIAIFAAAIVNFVILGTT